MRPVLACLAAIGLSATHVAAQDADHGSALFQTHCASCHGATAEGQGPLAPALVLQPTNLAALAASNGGEFPLERVLKRIDGTDPLVSHGSPMPVYGYFFEGEDAALKTEAGQPILTSQPILVSEPIADLVAYLMSLQK